MRKNIHNFILIILLNLIFLSGFCYAQKIDDLEDFVLGYNSTALPLEKRIQNVEQALYGSIQKGEPQKRVDKIHSDLMLDLKPIEKKPIDYYDETNNATKSEDKKSHLKNNTYDLNKKEPVLKDDFVKDLAKLEKSVLGGYFSSKSNEERIAQLEMALFGITYDEESMQERIERIKTVHVAQRSSSSYNENKFQKYLSTGVQIASVIFMILAFVL